MTQLDRFENAVIRLSQAHEEQPVKIQQDNNDWMTVKEICAALKISDSTFYAGIRDGTFPPVLSFSPKPKRWRL